MWKKSKNRIAGDDSSSEIMNLFEKSLGMSEEEKNRLTLSDMEPCLNQQIVENILFGKTKATT